MKPLDQVRSLNALGRYAEALKALEACGPDRSDQAASALRAELLEKTGRHPQARSVAEALLRSAKLGASFRAQCEQVIGRVLLEDGDTEAGLTRLLRAASIAHQAGDIRQLCWIQYRLLLVVSEHSGPDAAAPLVADLRRNATKLGDPQTTALVHVFLGEMEAKRGLLESASRHVRLGQQLLSGSPNCWIEAAAENVQLALCLMQSELDEGREHAKRAIAKAEESGAASARRSTCANAGNLAFLGGDFERAVEYFERALDVLPSNGDYNNAILEALARVRMAQQRFDECEQLLGRISATIRTEKDKSFYAHRHAELTSALLLSCRGRTDEAIRRVESVLALSTRTGDELLSKQALLTKAELLQQQGLASECLNTLEVAMRVAHYETPDNYAHYQKIVAAELLRVGDVHSAGLHFERARRISQMATNSPALLGLDRWWTEAKTSHIEVTTNDCCAASFQAGGRNALHSLAMVMQYASRPELVAAELVDLLAKTGCVTDATTFVRTADDAEKLLNSVDLLQPNEGASSPRRLIVSRTDERTVEIVARVRADFAAAMTLNEVEMLLARARDLELGRLERAKRATVGPVEEVHAADKRAVISGQMRELMTLAQRVARTTVNVLITGESGTGKEILARAVHAFSDRAQKPFVPLNCAAVPRDLLESQLFGHRRGAFTGADRDQLGLIPSAADGTLFLDEIAEMSLDLQPKLLRFLESGEIAPLGHHTTSTVNVRVIAATNANLQDAVRDGRFREDLFYRLNVVPLAIRPLRERRDEIPGMITHFVAAAALEYKKGYLEVAEETLERLLLYRWPGNVRQLQNEIRRMVALAEPNSTLEPAAISTDIIGAIPYLRPPANSHEISVPLRDKLLPTLMRIECEMVKTALRDHHGRMEPAAKSLGISRKGLYLKRRRLGL
jgi:DNA-binding NtrC family response regulator/tetratricopeptide (TPR) repeat protein